jgi:hypothetical protein
MVTLLFGHLSAIVALGVCRSALKGLRPHRVYSLAGSSGDTEDLVGKSNGKAHERAAVFIQWIGLAIIGIVFVVALKIVISSVHPTFLTSTSPVTFSDGGSSADSEPSSDGILSDHGPRRAGCDGKWPAQPSNSNYEDFLRGCMKGPP